MIKSLRVLDYIRYFCFIFSILISVSSQAQVSTDNGISSAMGETGTAFVNGFQSIGINPARLSFFETGNHRLTISLLPFGLTSNTNGLNTKLYNELFGKKTRNVTGNTTFWDDSDKDKFINAIDGSDLKFNANSRITGFGISYFYSPEVGVFGFTIRDNVGGNGTISKDYFDIALRGNVSKFQGKSVGSDNNQFSAWWNREYALSYSREFKLFKNNPEKNFFAGASLKYISGLQYVRGTGDVKIYSSTDSIALKTKYEYLTASSGYFNDTKNSFSIFPPSSGSGFGIDLGATMNFNKNISFGVSLNDLGWVSYRKNAEKRTLDTIARFTGLYDPIKASNQLDSLKRAIDNPKRDLSGFSASLPTHLRLGAAMKTDAYTKFPSTVTFDWIQGFNEQYGNTTTPIFGIGAEFIPFPNFPFRSGFRFGGREKIGWSLGLSLEYPNFSLDISTRDFIGAFTPSTTSRISFGLGMRIRFIDYTPEPPPALLPPPTPPQIVTFRTSTATINRGDTTVLVWEVAGTESVTISPVIGITVASGSAKLRPQRTTTYSITATNSIGTSTAQTIVNVIIPPLPAAPIVPKPVSIAPAVFTVPVTIDTKSYTLLLGTFSSKDEAEAFVVKYRKDGYKILINDTPAKGGNRYRVYAGTFKSLKEAKATLKEYKKLLPQGTKTEKMKAARAVKK